MSRAAILILTVAAFTSAFAQQNVLTGGYDNARTNADLNESILTPSAVGPNAFGKLFTLSVDGEIYAQPLYQQNVKVAGKGTHNVVLVATLHNTVYAFDADTAGTPLWSVNLGPSVPSSSYLSDEGPYTDLDTENGILGTPVIDPSTGTLYVVAATLENGLFFYRLHALDTGSGAERFGAPVTINAQTSGVGDSSTLGWVPFVASQHLQRPALLLLKGVVYVCFGSHGDAVPFHGWVLGYSALNVQHQVSVFNTTPNGSGGAIWQSGRGPAADENGNIYVVSSNGTTDFSTSFSDNVLRLSANGNSAADYFSPSDVELLNDTDDDLGASGAMLIPGTNYLVTGGKQGIVYLLDRTQLGHSTANDGQIPQSFNMGSLGIFNMALWNRADGPIVYLHIGNAPVVAYQLAGNRFPSAPSFQALTGFNVPFQGMTLAANGVQPGTGILWVLYPNSYPLPSHAVLSAYNADDLTELWNSDMAAADNLGIFSKFVNPTVANGKVYTPTASNELVVFGMTGSSEASVSPPAVTGVVNAASYANGPIAPGEIVAIFGQSLGPETLALGAFDSNGLMKTLVSGTQVMFNGIPAPLIYTSSGTVAAVVPYEIAGDTDVAFQMSYNGQLTEPVTLQVGAAAPGIFSADATGTGPGAILNSDYSLNSPTNPASQGSYVVVYATGGGQTNPPSSTGTVTTAPAWLTGSVSATMGGKPAHVLYAGNAGGEVTGALQLNVEIPAGVSGQVPVVITIAGQSSQATVMVSIQ